MGDMIDRDAVTVEVKPLVWHPENDGIGWYAECPLEPSHYYVAETVEQREEIEKTRAARILATLEPQPAPDAAAIREAALREAADYIEHAPVGTRFQDRDAILALITEKPHDRA